MYSKEVISSMFANEKSGTRSQYFSSKAQTSDGAVNENYFNSFKDKQLRIVGVEPVEATTASDGTRINGHNRVLFDDGHMMSTSALFNAKGLRWPVGGNKEKLRYILSAVEKQVAVVVVPQSVVTRFIQNRQGQFFTGKNTAGENIWTDGTGKDKKTPPAKAVSTNLYTFKDVVLPNCELIEIEED